MHQRAMWLRRSAVVMFSFAPHCPRLPISSICVRDSCVQRMREVRAVTIEQRNTGIVHVAAQNVLPRLQDKLGFSVHSTYVRVVPVPRA